MSNRLTDLETRGTAADTFRLIRPGTVRYADALDLQLQCHREVKDGRLAGALILLQHPPVITVGAGAKEENILASEEVLSRHGIEITETDRGGDATYHGPGQIVGYPIINLRARGNDVHEFLRLLESVVISTLSDYGLDGSRRGQAGVWVGNKKICSIGIAVRGGTTYHGFALNVNPDLRHFTFINPCGLDAAQITSMERLLGSAPQLSAVQDRVAEHFIEQFGITKTTE